MMGPRTALQAFLARCSVSARFACSSGPGRPARTACVAHAGRFARRARGARPACPGRLAGALTAVLVLAAVLVALPSRAYADDYTMGPVVINATVDANGSLTVVEQRTFDFDGSFNGVYWDIPLATNQQGAVSGVQVLSVRDLGDGSVFENAGAPGSASKGDANKYTTETKQGGAESVLEVMLYKPQEDAQTTYEITYRLTGAVMAWADTAELYWQFVGSEWQEPSSDVTLTVALPQAGPFTVGEDLRAWGHGPYNATVAIDESSAVVTYQVPRVSAGEFAEARIAFPASWVPGLTPSGENRLDTMLSEEQVWADRANAEREQARTVQAAGTAAQVALPAVFLALVAAFKLTHKKPRVAHLDYFRDVPSDDHPAVIAAFTHDSAVGNEAFIATLMKLTDDRVISISQERREEKRLLGTKTVEEYRIRLEDPARATDPIDRAALKLYFGEALEPGSELGFGDMRDGAKHGKKDYRSRHEDFCSEVTAALEVRNLVVSTGTAAAVAGIIVAAVLVIAALFMMLELETSPVAFAACLGMSVAAAAISCTFKRLTQEGAELDERCRALKHWLQDFTRLGEAVPGDLILWNKLLVLAVALGVSDEVLRRLADAVPPEQRQDVYGGYYYPVYWWCYPHYGLHSPVHEMNEAYSLTMSEISASANSSGAGMGGGFSGGGGGGVGGGGGGAF